MTCMEVREALPSYARDRYASPSISRHLDDCASCRTELARYERVLDSLARLASVTPEPPAGLVDSLARIPAEANLAQTLMWRAGSMTGHFARNRAAYLGGLGVALAGAAAALWRTRARRVAAA